MDETEQKTTQQEQEPAPAVTAEAGRSSAMALPLFLEGVSVLAGALIGYFVFDQLLYGFCFGLAVGIAFAMLVWLIRNPARRTEALPLSEDTAESAPAQKEEESKAEEEAAQGEALPGNNAGWQRRE